MSKVATLLEIIRNTYVMGVDGLADYHAAKACINAGRCREISDKLARVRKALKNHRVMVSVMGGAIRVYRPDTGAEFMI